MKNELVEALLENPAILNKYDESALMIFKGSTKSADEIVELLTKHGDDAVPLYYQYGDSIIDLILKHGDSAVDGIRKYGHDYLMLYNSYKDEFAQAYAKHGDDAVDAYLKYGDEAWKVLDSDPVTNPGDGTTTTDNKIFIEGVEVRNIDESIDTDLIKQIKDIRDVFTGKYKGGNFGYCKVYVDGLVKRDYYAHSGIKNYEQIADAQFAEYIKNISRQYSYEESIFKPMKVNSQNIVEGTDAWLRNVDTEHKMIEEISRKLGDNKLIEGKIILFTELPPCPSCSNVIEQFKKQYPNIDIIILHNNGEKLK